MDVCKSCGHEGSKENPLAVQGDRIVPSCHVCLKLAEMAAGIAVKKVGLYGQLSKEQQQAALAYKGPVNSGSKYLPYSRR